nr:stage V sporulation T C-terminal domain-containing protein [uncultured Blautia sp.]
MKATGIVRRIDDLGRVVIPKEIRKTLRIKEGTPMEIYTDRQGEIILKKYSPIGELDIFAKEYTEALFQTTGFTACITDRDQVVAAAGPGSRELMGKSISRELEKVIAERSTKSFDAGERKKIPITENQKEMRNSGIIQPVVSSSDAIGTVILIGKNERDIIGNAERMLVQTAAGFLGKQIEQ